MRRHTASFPTAVPGCGSWCTIMNPFPLPCSMPQWILPMSAPKKILILGGGFGGVYTARKLEKLLRPEEAEITLVAPVVLPVHQRDLGFLRPQQLFQLPGRV